MKTYDFDMTWIPGVDGWGDVHRHNRGVLRTAKSVAEDEENPNTGCGRIEYIPRRFGQQNQTMKGLLRERL